MTEEQKQKFAKAAEAPEEIQVVIGNKTVTAVKIGYSFMTDSALYEAQMPVTERKPRKVKDGAIPPGPQTVRGTQGKK